MINICSIKNTHLNKHDKKVKHVIKNLDKEIRYYTFFDITIFFLDKTILQMKQCLGKMHFFVEKN